MFALGWYNIFNRYIFTEFIFFLDLQENMPIIFRRDFIKKGFSFLPRTQFVRGQVLQNDPKVIPKEKIILRKSIYCIIIRFVVIEVIFDSLYLFVKFPAMYLHFPLSLQNTLTPLYFLLFVILNTFKLLLMITIALKWITNHYEINKREIRHKSGVFGHKEQVYLCDFAQEVSFSQSLLGRILNYGTVDVYNPAIKERIYLDSIPNPAKFSEVIKKNLPDEGTINYMAA
jgi:membrane protein YdbS with pleckstrin-like domain